MSEEKTGIEDRPEANRKLLLVLGAIAVVIAGSLLLFFQVNSDVGCAGEGLCMLFFSADWWEVCQKMEPIVGGLGEKYGSEFRIVRVDVDTSQGKQLAREQGIIGQPAYVFFDRSGEQVRRLMGAHPTETFEREIERILRP